jgi:hypothetical protein
LQLNCYFRINCTSNFQYRIHFIGLWCLPPLSTIFQLFRIEHILSEICSKIIELLLCQRRYIYIREHDLTNKYFLAPLTFSILFHKCVLLLKFIMRFHDFRCILVYGLTIKYIVKEDLRRDKDIIVYNRNQYITYN